MKKENNSKQKPAGKGKKGAVIGLTVGLILALGAAGATTALYMTKKPEAVKTYTVKFLDIDGTTELSNVQKVIAGEKATKPQNPTKSGKKFVTWLKKGTSDTFDFTQSITGDIELVAYWEDETAAKVNVRFLPGNHGKLASEVESITLEVSKGIAFGLCQKPNITANKDWIHTGWSFYGSSEKINSEMKVEEEWTVVAYYESSPAKVNLNLLAKGGDENIDPWTVSVRGETTYTFLESDGNKYDDIKSILPTAEVKTSTGTIGEFKYWSFEPQTNTGVLPAEIDYTQTIKNGDVLYPVFSFTAPTQTIKLTVHVIDDGFHKQTLQSGSTIIEVPYKQGSTSNKTFKDINKPAISETVTIEGKTKTCVLGGYYKSYNSEDGTFDSESEWKNTEVISDDSDIYVKMVPIATEPVVTFAADEDQTDLTWVGNQEIKVSSGTKLSEISAPNPYKDAKPNPNPDLGFITKYYFDGWYKKGDASKTKVVPGNVTITESVTFCPIFKEKTTIVIQTDLHDTEQISDKNYYLDEVAWSQVATPTPSGATGDEIFTGWYGKNDDDTEFLLTDTTQVGVIAKIVEEQKETTITKTVVPHYADKKDCHIINFDTVAYLPSGEKYDKSVTLVGASSTAVVADAENPIVLNKAINKPLVPNTDGKEEINKGITFTNQWKIAKWDGTGTEPAASEWTLLTDEFEIAAAAEKATYTLRPIVTKKANIVFDINLDTEHQGLAEFKKWDSGETYANISVSTSTQFGDMFKPEIEFKEGANMSFLYWATKDAQGNYKKVEATDVFTDTTSPITLYAVYSDSKVSSTINFHISQAEYDAGARLNNLEKTTKFTVTINNDLAEVKTKLHTFSDFAQPVTTYAFHHLGDPVKYAEQDEKAAWYYIDATTKEKKYITDDTKINYGGNGLDLYANFYEDYETYHKITIKKDESKYFIDGDTEFYVLDNSTPFDSYTHQFKVDGFSTKAWSVGFELIGWKDSSGKMIDEKTGITSDLTNIEPVFDTTQKKVNVTFSKNGDDTITINNSSVLEVPINGTLLDKIGDRTASKTGATFANKWKILNADKSTSEITTETRIKADTTLIPVFIDEEVYAHGEKAYFYDTNVGKWADITSFDDTQFLYVRYSDGSVGTVEKATFNYQVKIGDKMTQVPDNFMTGCSQWNNGATSEEESIPLAFPTTIRSIGNNFMYGCTSFNQPVTLDIDANKMQEATYGNAFMIGENFMRNCSSLNSKVSIKAINTEGQESGQHEAFTFVIADNFMLDCVSFGNTLDLTGWANWSYMDSFGSIEPGSAENFYTCLASSDLNCKQFTVIVSPNGFAGQKPYDTFVADFPILDGSESWTYRKELNVITPQ